MPLRMWHKTLFLYILWCNRWTISWCYNLPSFVPFFLFHYSSMSLIDSCVYFCYGCVLWSPTVHQPLHLLTHYSVRAFDYSKLTQLIHKLPLMFAHSLYVQQSGRGWQPFSRLSRPLLSRIRHNDRWTYPSRQQCIRIEQYQCNLKLSLKCLLTC